MEDYTEISGVVSKIRRRLRADQKMADFRVLDNWENIVGKKFAPHTKPLFIVDGALYIETTGSSWSQEISYRKNAIITELNRLFGKEKITDIRIRAGGKDDL